MRPPVGPLQCRRPEGAKLGAVVASAADIDIREHPPSVRLVHQHAVGGANVVDEDRGKSPFQREGHAFIEPDLPCLARFGHHQQPIAIKKKEGKGEMKRLFQRRAKAMGFVRSQLEDRDSAAPGAEVIFLDKTAAAPGDGDQERIRQIAAVRILDRARIGAERRAPIGAGIGDIPDGFVTHGRVRCLLREDVRGAAHEVPKLQADPCGWPRGQWEARFVGRGGKAMQDGDLPEQVL